jgi:DNA-binding response OmpR family regulator
VGRVLLVAAARERTVRLAELLGEAGHEVETLSDSRIAVERIGEAAPDLMITDAVMPYFDGFHLSSELRRRHPGSGARVMMITGLDAVGKPYRGWDGSVDAYADPPFDPLAGAQLAEDLLRRAR